MKPALNATKHLPHRTLWIDACRGIAIILVLLGHNNPPFVRTIYGFHMPLFLKEKDLRIIILYMLLFLFS